LVVDAIARYSASVEDRNNRLFLALPRNKRIT